MARGDKQRIGLAGEHYVASELLRRDWNAALTFGNTAHTDVLAERGDTRKPITIQVKAKQRRGGGWWMPGPADPARRDVDEWFIFVDFAVEEGATPVVYVVPRDHVAALGNAQHALYPSSGGKMINVHDIDGYEGAWKLLERPADKAKSRLPDWVQDKCTDARLRRALNLRSSRKRR